MHQNVIPTSLMHTVRFVTEVKLCTASKRATALSKACIKSCHTILNFSKSCRQDLENSKTCRQDLELSKSWHQDLEFSKSHLAARSGILQILQAFFGTSSNCKLEFMQTDKLHYNSAKPLTEICQQKKF